MVRFELRSAETHAGPGSAFPPWAPCGSWTFRLTFPQQNGRALSPAFAV